MTALLSNAFGLLLQSTLLLAVGLLALRLTRKRGPAVQSMVGRATLTSLSLLLLAAPLTSDLPAVWRVSLPMPSPHLLALSQATSQVPPATGGLGEVNVDSPSANVGDFPSGPRQEYAVEAKTAAPRPPVAGRPVRSRLRQSKEVGAWPLLSSYPTLAAVWLLGSTILLLWLGLCQGHLTRLRRTAQPVLSGPAWETLASLTPYPPCLLTHSDVLSPFLAGIRRPAIFLPTSYQTEFDAEALRAILAHELAHLTRRDNAWTLASRLLAAVFWPQPLLWLLGRRLEQIGEEACDETVLARDCSPRAYADCLLTLAARPPLGRRERALGAGVTPFRSSVGRRIQIILSATSHSITIPTFQFRLSVALVVLTSSVGATLLFGAATEIPHFERAKKEGWSVQPIHIVHINHPGLTRVNTLPYDLTKEDKNLIKQLEPIASMTYNSSWVPPTSHKVELLRVLATHPHFFYAQYILGAWYQRHGDEIHGAALQEQALQNAPTILAGRVEYEDGSPVAGFEFSTSIKCFQPSNTKARRSAFEQLAPILYFPSVVTDSDGCYYLPLYRGLYCQVGMAYTPDYLNSLVASHLKAHAYLFTPGPVTAGTTDKDDVTWLDTGFYAESRVAVMPQTEIRARVQWNNPFVKLGALLNKPLRLTEHQMTVSWKPYPKADHYRVTVNEYHIGGGSWEMTPIASEPGSITPLNTAVAQTSITLNLAGDKPVFNRTYSYSISIEAFDARGETLSQSDSGYFMPLKGIAPEPITSSAIAQALGPGFNITSMQVWNDKVIVNALTPPNLKWTPATDDAITYSGKRFGLDFGGWASKQGISIDANNMAKPICITYRRSFGQAPTTKILPASLGIHHRSSIAFLDAQIRGQRSRLRATEGALSVYKAGHQPQMLYSQRKLAELTRNYSSTADLYSSLARKRQEIQLHLSLDTVRGGQSGAAAEETRKMLGYGLQLILTRKRYCRAVDGSLAAHMGISTSDFTEIIAVDGQPASLSDARFLALLHLPPPFRLTLRFGDNHTRTVVFLAKDEFKIPTNAAISEDKRKDIESKRAELNAAKQDVDRTKQLLGNELHKALPQADAKTLAAGFLVEEHLGAVISRVTFVKEYKIWCRKKKNPQSYAKAVQWELQAQYQMRKSLAEEAELLPKTDSSVQFLPQLHALAVQLRNLRFEEAIKQNILSATLSVMEEKPLLKI